jgi:hypothetical protein
VYKELQNLPKATPARAKWQIDVSNDLPSDQTRGANGRNLPIEFAVRGKWLTAGNSFEMQISAINRVSARFQD